MADNEGAVFNEVLQISANPEQFIQDLQKIEEAWSQSLARMAEQANSATGNPLSAIAAGSSSDFAQLQTSLENLTKILSTQFQALEQTILASLDKVNAALETTKTKTEQVGQAAEEAAGGPYRGNKQDLIPVDFEGQRERFDQLRGAGQDAYEALTASGKNWYDTMAETSGKTLAKQEADLDALRERTLKAYAQFKSLSEEQQQKIATAGGSKAAPENLQLLEPINLPAITQIGQSIDAVNLKLTEGKTIAGSFWEGFAGDGLAGIAATVGQLTQWYIIFQAILGVFSLIKEAAMALPQLFERGFEFLSKMQAKAEDLQAILATKVTLSVNPDDNFALAGDASEKVLMRLRQDAAGLNLDFEKLAVGFKDFVGAGGASLVQNLDEAVKATELMQRAIKGMTSDQRESKTIQAEIPQLLDGSVQQSSRLLQIMGLTKQEWLDIRASAIEQGNLLSVLQDKLSAFVKVGDALPGTWQSLTAQAQLFLDIIGSDLASSAFEKLTEYARQLSKYYLEHREQIDAVFSALGQVVGAFIDVTAAVVKLLVNTGLLKAIVIELIDPLIVIAGLFTAQAAGAELALKLVDALSKLLKGDVKEAWQEAIGAVKEYNQNIENTIVTTGKGLGFKVPEGDGQDPLKISTRDSQLPVTGSTGEVGRLNKQQADDLQLIRDRYDEVRIAAKDAGDGVSNAAARSSEVIKAYHDQLREEKDLLEKNYEAILRNVNITPEEKGKATADLLVALNKADRDADKAISAEARAGRREALSEALNDYHERLSAIETNAAREIAINKDLEATHVITAEQGRAQRKEIYDAEYASIVKLVNDSKAQLQGLGATARQFDPNKAIGQAEVKDLQGKGREDQAEANEERREQETKYRVLLRGVQEFHAAELALDREAHAEGLSNNATYIQQLITAENNRYNSEKAILQREIDDVRVSVQAKARAEEQLQNLESQHRQATLLDDQKLAQARRQDTDELLRHLQAVGNAEAEAQNRHKAAKDAEHGDNEAVKRDNLELIKIRENEVDTAIRVAESEELIARANRVTGKALDELIEKTQRLKNERQALADQAASNSSDDSEGKQLAGNVFGSKNVATLTDDSATGLQKFTAGLNAATNAVGVFQNFLSAIKQGEAQGGTLGGIGAGLSQAAALDPEPISKAILGIAGSVTSLLGGFFQAAARRIAEEAKKQFEGIQERIQDNIITLGEGVKELEAERAQAIQKLSGVKGGKDQLDKLIPEFDKAIRQAIEQQKQIINNFEDQVVILREQTQIGQNWLTQWKDINAQVKQYLDAGGSKSTAAEFLQEKLQAMTLDITNQYRDAEQGAVQDALKLNDMLDQRVKLQESITKNLDDQKKIQDEISKISASENDSIVRREAGAITAARDARDKKQALEDQLTALKTQAADDQKQLADMNEQIDLQTIRVQKETQIFGISTDLAELHREDEQLSLAALDQEVAKWTELKTLMGNLSSSTPQIDPATGLFYGTSPFSNTPGGVPGVNTTPTLTGAPVDPATLEKILTSAFKTANAENPHGVALQEAERQINDTLAKFASGALSQQDTLSYLTAERDYAKNNIIDPKSLSVVTAALNQAIQLLTAPAAGSPVAVGGPALPTSTPLVQTLNTQLDTLTKQVQSTSNTSTTALTTTLNTQLSTVTNAVNAGSAAIVLKLAELNGLRIPTSGPIAAPSPAPISIVVQAVHVGAGIDPYTAGKQIGGGIWDEFNYRYRAGLT